MTMATWQQLLDEFKNVRTYSYSNDFEREEAMLSEMEHMMHMILEKLCHEYPNKSDDCL